MSNNIDQLLSKAEEIGTSEVPVGSGNSPEIQDALMQLFKQHPKSWFRSKDLGKALTDSGYKCNKVSDVLFAMRKADKIQSPKKGIYGYNNGEHIDHPTPGSKDSEESTEE